jgi:hypothetical protein
MSNTINWFEIPAVDFQRACDFYGKILAGELQKTNMGGFDMGFLPMEQGSTGVGGAIVTGEGYTPSSNGSVVYLNGGENLQTILDRVSEAGGNIVLPKTQITPEIGYFAFFIDSEGNKIGLHSRN